MAINHDLTPKTTYYSTNRGLFVKYPNILLLKNNVNIATIANYSQHFTLLVHHNVIFY